MILAMQVMLACLAPPAVAQDDPTWNKWNHNGSTMYLQWNGRNREIYYLHPRPGLIPRGVRQGTLLFSGTRYDQNYTGTAYVFSLCGPVGYQVSGSVASDLKSIRLYGKVPVLDRSCNVTGYRDDVLDFTALDDGDCGCECPSEIPVADIDAYVSSGDATSCPYLYAWSDTEQGWSSYGKVIHVAQGRHRETVEEIKLRELSTRFRLAEEEPENSFIDKVELRVETDKGIYALKPSLKRLAARDGAYAFIGAYKQIEFSFRLPPGVDRASVKGSTLTITGYYERLSKAPPSQCYARIVQRETK